jgi:hypothetical protein
MSHVRARDRAVNASSIIYVWRNYLPVVSRTASNKHTTAVFERLLKQ